jgi:hypothetical protein
MTLDLEVNEVEVKVLTSLASVTAITGWMKSSKISLSVAILKYACEKNAILCVRW